MDINFLKKNKKEKKEKNVSLIKKDILTLNNIQDIILIFNIITITIAYITEIFQQKEISDFFYILSIIGIVFLSGLVLVIKKIIIKNYKNIVKSKKTKN